MLKQNKTGFTIVELIIVIAVVAVLAAVLIPTFSGMINKSDLSSDIQNVKNMNIELENNYQSTNIIPNDINDVKLTLDSYKNVFTPKTNGYHYYWNKGSRTIYLIKDVNNKFEIAFPKDENNNIIKENCFRLDNNFYSIICNIEGITIDKTVVEKGTSNIDITLKAKDGYQLPIKINVEGGEQNQYKNGIVSISSITNDIIITKLLAYLCFTAEQELSTIIFKPKIGTWEYSLDTCVTWNEGNPDKMITLPNIGDKVYLRGYNCKTDQNHNFILNGLIAASCDVTSLTNGLGGDAELTDSCYLEMFRGCFSLTKAPELPSTVLSESCYNSMFQECTSLVTAPELPATTLAIQCYNSMFNGCYSLINVPETLPATILPHDCYATMFSSCMSIKKTPKILATTLSNSCCNSMFFGCTSLKVTNILPNGKEGTDYGIIFTCPETVDITTPVSNMFYSTGGTFTSLPQANTTYYWYEEPMIQ